MTLPMRDYGEKRGFIRMKVDSRIELRLCESELVLTGICRDLSGTGMAIELDENFAIGTEFFACLPSNNANFPPFESHVRVVRTATTDNERCLIGVEIINTRN